MKSKLLLATIILTGFSMSTIAQEENVDMTLLDEIFNEWNTIQKPGIAAGVLRFGKPIYLKGFGSANLEYDIPIDIQTKFQIGDLSKQFTALAILVLEARGKISLDDEVRKYIPSLPKYTVPLNIGHLLNHTSGLNDYTLVHSLKVNSDNELFTQKDAIKLIAAQEELNFEPGKDFSYTTSDTETTLMAEIVSNVSGQSFSSFMKEHIFEPLGMNNSIIRDDYKMLVSNVAASYRVVENNYKKRTLAISTYGSTNVYTSVEDLGIWYSHFASNTKKLGSLIKKLDTPIQLSDGKTYDSSWGRMTIGNYFLHNERGLPKYWHYGLIGGYGANVFRFSEQNLVSFVIGNNAQYNGSLAMQAAEPFLEDSYTEPPVVDFSKIKTKQLQKSQLEKFTGNYWNAERGLSRNITLIKDSLRYVRAGSTYQSALVPLSRNLFQMKVESDDIVKIDFSLNDGKKSFHIYFGDGDPELYQEITPIEYTNDELEQFIGDYTQQDIDAHLNFSVKKDLLYAKNSEGTETIFYPVFKDVFRSDSVALGSIKFSRKPSGEIEGFSITTDGIQNLIFEKE